MWSVGLVRSVRSVPQELTYLVTNNREVVGLIVDNLGPPLGILSQLSGTDIGRCLFESLPQNVSIKDEFLPAGEHPYSSW